MINPKTREQMWTHLEQAQLPPEKQLRALSGLEPAETQRLAALWPGLPVALRRTLTATLSRMAESNFALDYAAFFRVALLDEDAEVRIAAITGLQEDEDIRLITQFGRMLTSDPAIEVRAAAAQALGRFILLGEMERIHTRAYQNALQALIQCHNHPQEPLAVRRRALEGLAYTSQIDVRALITAGYAHPEEEMRVSAVLAMGRSADQHWAATVRRELRSPSPEMRYEATRACGELGLRAAVRDLVDLVEDVDARVQEMALWALGQVGGALARRTLERYSLSTNPDLQAAAETAIEELDFVHGDVAAFFGNAADFPGGSELSWEEDAALRAQVADSALEANGEDEDEEEDSFEEDAEEDEDDFDADDWEDQE